MVLMISYTWEETRESYNVSTILFSKKAGSLTRELEQIKFQYAGNNRDIVFVENLVRERLASIDGSAQVVSL